MPTRNAAGLLLALALLAACRMNSQHEVFLSDVRDVAAGTQPGAEFESTLRTQFPTSDRCEQYRQRVREIFARYQDGVSEGRCVNSERFVDLVFSAKGRLIRHGAGPIPPNTLFALAAGPGATPGTVNIVGLLDRTRLAQIQAEIRAIDFDTSRQSITAEGITLVLHNDTAGVAQLRGPAAFVNGEPAPIVGAEIARRGRLELRVSDVAAAQINRTGQTLIAVLVGQ